MTDVIPAPAQARLAVRGGGTFPVRRVYCVGRNFADHAREMGAAVAASKATRGQPVFFMKPADALVTGGVVHYPPATVDLHHEVELWSPWAATPRPASSTANTPHGWCSATAWAWT